MPKHYCCVPKCSSHSRKHTVKFFRIPADRKLRSKWKLKIGRGHTFSITDHTRICGNHFVSGKRSYDPNDIDYIPSIFQFSLKPKNRYCARCRRSTCKCKVSVNTNEPQGNANEGQDGTDNTETSTSNLDGDVYSKLQDEIKYLRIQLEHDANTILRQSAKIEELTTRYQQQLEKKDEIIENLRNKIIERNILHQKDTADLLTSKDAALENLKSSFTKSAEVLRKLHKTKLDESLDQVKLESEETIRNAKRELEMKVSTLQEKSRQCLSYENCANSDDLVRFFTGLPSKTIFESIFSYFEPFAEEMRYWRGKNVEIEDCEQNPEKKRKHAMKVSLKDQLFLTLCRCRRGFKIKELAYFFGISRRTVTKIFITWMRLIDAEIPTIFPSVPLTTVVESLPQHIRNKYPNLYGLLDCTEFYVETPSSLIAQSTCFSQYKHYTTYKVLYLTSPIGAILFVSPIYSGKTTDKSIVLDSGVLNTIPKGSEIFVDRGFEITTECTARRIRLHIPAFKGTRNQLAQVETWETELIANCRIHVERAIRRIKTFHIFDSDLPISMATTSPMIIRVVSYFQNFLGPLIAKNSACTNVL